MDKFERFFRALNLEEPDRVPIMDIVSPVFLEKLTGMKAIVGTEMIMHSREEILNNLVNIEVKGIRKLDLDAALMPDVVGPRDVEITIVDERTLINEWGGKYTFPPNLRMVLPMYVGGTIDNPEEFEPPDPHAEGITESYEMMYKELGKEMPVIPYVDAFWEMVKDGRGHARILSDFILNPTIAEKLLDMNINYYTEVCKAYVDLGAPAIFSGDDVAWNKGLQFSPDIFRKFFKPRIKKFVDTFAKREVPVLFHSDGNYEAVMNDLIDVGIKCFANIEPQSMDIGDIKRKYGNRVCLMGNIDCTFTLPYGTPEDVRKEVRLCIDKASKGGGHIMSSSNSIHYYCKPENVLAMIDETKKYGVHR